MPQGLLRERHRFITPLDHRQCHLRQSDSGVRQSLRETSDSFNGKELPERLCNALEKTTKITTPSQPFSRIGQVLVVVRPTEIVLVLAVPEEAHDQEPGLPPKF
jgi:hypothetical protein